MSESKNSFNAKKTLEVGGKSYDYYALDAVEGMEKLPYSLKVLGENLLRTGPHLHFEIMPDGENKVDPVPWFAERGITV